MTEPHAWSSALCIAKYIYADSRFYLQKRPEESGGFYGHQRRFGHICSHSKYCPHQARCPIFCAASAKEHFRRPIFHGQTPPTTAHLFAPQSHRLPGQQAGKGSRGSVPPRQGSHNIVRVPDLQSKRVQGYFFSDPPDRLPRRRCRSLVISMLNCPPLCVCHSDSGKAPRDRVRGQSSFFLLPARC